MLPINKDAKFFLLIITTITIAFYYFFFSKQIEKLKAQNTLLSQSLHTYTDANGRQVATIKEIQLNRATLKDSVEQLKKDLNLQMLKPGKVKYITVVNTETKTQYATNTIVKYKDSLPVYSSYDSTEWHTITTMATIDSTIVNYTIRNKFITTSQNMAPWYKKPDYQIITINLNPNTKTKEMVNYSLKPKAPKRLGWLVAGLIIGGIIGTW